MLLVSNTLFRVFFDEKGTVQLAAYLFQEQAAGIVRHKSDAWILELDLGEVFEVFSFVRQMGEGRVKRGILGTIFQALPDHPNSVEFWSVDQGQARLVLDALKVGCLAGEARHAALFREKRNTWRKAQRRQAKTQKESA